MFPVQGHGTWVLASTAKETERSTGGGIILDLDFRPFLHGLPGVCHGDLATEGASMSKARILWDGRRGPAPRRKVACEEEGDEERQSVLPSSTRGRHLRHHEDSFWFCPPAVRQTLSAVMRH